MLNESQAWLCIVNEENFEIISKKKVYGVPDRSLAMKRISEVKENDILLFYVISPVRRIRGKSRALSPMFQENNKAPWKDRLYPYRIKIADVEEVNIPLRNFITRIRSVKGRIPRGASLISLKKEDFEIIVKWVEKRGNRI